MPAPENFSMDYLLSSNPQKIRNILSVKEIKLSKISQNKIYPAVPDLDTRDGGAIARNFINGLTVLGFGQIDNVTKSFKRFHPDDEDCRNNDDLRRKWIKLGMMEG